MLFLVIKEVLQYLLFVLNALNGVKVLVCNTDNTKVLTAVIQNNLPNVKCSKIEALADYENPFL